VTFEPVPNKTFFGEGYAYAFVDRTFELPRELLPATMIGADVIRGLPNERGRKDIKIAISLRREARFPK
jgi:hypothetical protein